MNNPFKTINGMLTGFSNYMNGKNALTVRPSEKWAGFKPTDHGILEIL